MIRRWLLLVLLLALAAIGACTRSVLLTPPDAGFGPGPDGAMSSLDGDGNLGLEDGGLGDGGGVLPDASLPD